jgi:hypothetical protein
MNNPSHVKKISVLALSMILFGASLFPIAFTAKIPEQKNPDITIDVATTVANTKLQELQKTQSTITKSTEIRNKNAEPLFYIFELQPPGYIIVTGSYNLPPVIAYSFTTNFDDHTEENPLFDLLYADITLRLQYLSYVPENTLTDHHLQWDTYMSGSPLSGGRFEQWPAEGTTPTGGWLLTNWHQSAPYNNFCPLDIAHQSQRSVAGCPAVTMAQILNYHNTTMNVHFDDSDDYYHAYNGNNFWIDNNYIQYGFKSYPDLNTYLETLQQHYDTQTAPTNDDKAAITFACGVAATQVYAASGSGTFGVGQAYDAYQRFNCTTSSLLDENSPDLYERISSNMKDGLPAHLAVVNEGSTVGHNLVVDGYNTNDYYHMNFGWGGSYNGWYLLPEELPYELTVIEGIIVDILNDDLQGEGSLQWADVIPCESVTGTFTITNNGDPCSNLNWEVSETPSWGTWTFTPPNGRNLRPEDGAFTITAKVVAPNEEYQTFTGNIVVTNTKNNSDSITIPVTLTTGKKIHEKVVCNGSLAWVDVKTKSTITGSFTVANEGASFSNLSWKIASWPEWGTFTFTPSEGVQLTPEDGPVLINVTIIAPLRRNTEFTGEIKVINSENESDFDTIPVTLATPYPFYSPLLAFLQMLLQQFPHAFPLLRLLLLT